MNNFMNKTCAFTICAKNYLGLALTLRQSFLVNNTESDFFIFIADEFDKPIKLDSNIFISKDVLSISSEIWTNMSFKYEITEFCTSIKPFCFDYLFRTKKYNKVIYLDPDTFVFNSFDYVFDNLDTNLFITTPHILSPLTADIEYLSETGDTGFLRVGINNFGFVGVRKSEKSLHIIDWWKYKLENHCFDEKLSGTFTDQKWMEFLPSFLEQGEYLCSKNRGLNLAPWNFFERKIIKDNDVFYVENRISPKDTSRDKLIFAHFAGYNYKQLFKGNSNDRIRNKNLKTYEDISLILIDYISELNKFSDAFKKYICYDYSYNRFSNGQRIDIPQRRIYNSLFTDYNFSDNPFLDTKQSFYQLLKKNNLVDLSKETKVDKMSPNSLKGFNQKLSLLYKVLRIFKAAIGYRNYILFFRLMRHLCKYENQVFLLGKKYNSKKIVR